MDIWKYYDGDLKYPDLIKHTEEKEIAKTNTKWARTHLILAHWTSLITAVQELRLQ